MSRPISVREYAVLYLRKGKASGSTTLSGGNVLLNAGKHPLGGPEHTGQLPADRVSLEDTDGHYTADDAEAAFDEIAEAVAAHLADTADAHDATAISFTPNGSIAATDVQAAIQEVRDEASGSGLSSGTSNPGSPSDGDLFYRTDLDLLIRYRSTGTRWVTVQQYVISVALQVVVIPLSANNSFYGALPNSTHDLWIETIDSPTQVQTTNDGSNFWTLTYQRAGSGTGLGSAFTTAADTAGTPARHTVTVNALSGTSDVFVQVSMIKTGAPGTLYMLGAAITYRKVVT